MGRVVTLYICPNLPNKPVEIALLFSFVSFDVFRDLPSITNCVIMVVGEVEGFSVAELWISRCGGVIGTTDLVAGGAMIHMESLLEVLAVART